MIRGSFDDQGNHVQIEIKKEFLTDYLAARNLSLRLTYYRQRVEMLKKLKIVNMQAWKVIKKSETKGNLNYLFAA